MIAAAQPGDPCRVRNAVALSHEVDSIRQAPSGLGVGHRADSHWTGWNAETSGIPEAMTTARGHSFGFYLRGRMSTTSKTTPVDSNAVSSNKTQSSPAHFGYRSQIQRLDMGIPCGPTTQNISYAATCQAQEFRQRKYIGHLRWPINQAGDVLSSKFIRG